MKANEKSSSVRKEKTNYHHGELRQQLMDLALQHIASAGTEKLSLRALAREANVSATAPFRHFSNKQALFAALAVDGFEQLGERVQKAGDSADPIEQRLLSVAMAYVDFSNENPVTYQLMFGSILGDFAAYEGLSATASKAYSYLDDLLSEVVQAKCLGVDELVLGALIWSTIHGFSSLRLNVLQFESSKIDAVEIRPRKALIVMSEDLEHNLKIMIDGLIGISP
jgi:AcrR family transcriptional regulator